MNSLSKADTELLVESETIEIVLEKVICTNNFVFEGFTVYPGGEGVLGFLGDHFKIKVTYYLNGVYSQVLLFMKTTPRTNARRIEHHMYFRLFERESLFYNEILSQFKDESDDNAWSPKCYFAFGNNFIFEDLNSKGFTMCDLRTLKNKAHIHTTLKSLARFHAQSILLVERKTKENKTSYNLQEEFGKELGSGFFSNNVWYKNCIRPALAVAGQSKKYGKSTEYFNKVKSEWEMLFINASKLLNASDEYYNVVTHLDLWNNNLMYKYDEEGNPLQCIFVDYQACGITPPAADVVAFLYLNLNKESRDKHLEEYITFYYDEVSSILNQNHINIDSILPWISFRKSCDDYRLWGLIESIILYQFLFLDSKKVVDSLSDSDLFDRLIYGDRSEMVLTALKGDALFSERMMEYNDELVQPYICN